MASYSEVKVGLDAIAEVIRAQKLVLATIKQDAQSVSDAISVLPIDYADVAATVQAFGVGNAAESTAKAELAKLAAEYQELKATADALVAVA